MACKFSHPQLLLVQTMAGLNYINENHLMTRFSICMTIFNTFKAKYVLAFTATVN